MMCTDVEMMSGYIYVLEPDWNELLIKSLGGDAAFRY